MNQKYGFPPKCDDADQTNWPVVPGELKWAPDSEDLTSHLGGAVK